MKRTAMNLMLLASLFTTPVMVGCDKTVSEDKTVKTNSDGSTEVKHEKTVEKSDGTVEKTTEHKVEK